MRAGKLDKRVTLQTRTESQGLTGEVTWTWADTVTVWAAIEPVSEREYFTAHQVQADSTTRIRIRHRSRVTPKMRVKYVEDVTSSPLLVRYYSIEGVREMGRNRELHLMCREREADGWQD